MSDVTDNPVIGFFLIVVIVLVIGMAIFSPRSPSNTGNSHPTFQGDVSCTFDPNSRAANINIAKLINDGPRASGELKLAVWACDGPFNGGTIQGVKLGEKALTETLGSGYEYNRLTQTIKIDEFPSFEQPKTIVVGLLENGFIADWRNIAPPYTFNRSVWLSWYERLYR